MKHLKKFNENWNYKHGERPDFSLAEDIANDLLPRFEKMRNSGQSLTIEDFEKYMKEKGANMQLCDTVLSILVDKGFVFDGEEEIEEIEPGDYVSFEKHGLLYVVSIMGDGYLVSDDETERYKGDDGDGFIIPFTEEGNIIEKG